MANEFLSWMLGDTPALKEISLDEAASRIRQAVYQKHDPAAYTDMYVGGPKSIAASTFYVVDIYPGFVVVSKDDGFYKVSYAVTPEGITVGDDLVRVEKAWVEVV